MKILTMTPFATDRNLGAAYNGAMDRLEEDEWACLLDHDMMFTTKHWYFQLEEAIRCVPDAGVVTAITNRIGAPWQRTGPYDGHEMGVHYRLGEERLKVRTLLDISCTKGFGGVLMLLSKRAWRASGGFADGLLCVDHSLHFALRRVGLRAYLHEGLYVYHRRRAFGGELPPDTPRAANCPCRGAEIAPTIRVTLP